MHDLVEAIEAHCPVCGRPPEPPLQRCPRCDTPHHRDCWDYNEGCAVYGCKASLSVARTAAARSLREAGAGGAPLWAAWLASLLSTPTWAYRWAGLVALYLGLVLASRAGLDALTGDAPTVVAVVGVLALGLVLLAAAPLLELTGRHAGARLLARAAEEPAALDLKALEVRVAADPRNFNLLELLAYSSYAAGDFERARELYRDALERLPGHRQVKLQLARTLYRLGDLPAARRAFDELVQGAPDESEAQSARWWLSVIDGRSAEQHGLLRGRPDRPETEKG